MNVACNYTRIADITFNACAQYFKNIKKIYALAVVQKDSLSLTLGLTLWHLDRLRYFLHLITRSECGKLGVFCSLIIL